MRYRYVYEGPVLCMDHLYASKWRGETVAETEKKAKSNLAYQFKKDANLVKTARVSLPGKLKELEAIL